VENLRLKLRELVSSDIELGAVVKIQDGLYRGLEGVVIELDSDNAFVLVKLRSIRIIATLPKVFLEGQEDG